MISGLIHGLNAYQDSHDRIKTLRENSLDQQPRRPCPLAFIQGDGAHHSKKAKATLKKGGVMLFQGDSIMDAGRDVRGSKPNEQILWERLCLDGRLPVVDIQSLPKAHLDTGAYPETSSPTCRQMG